jgi:DNA polymerase (family 10)
VRAFIEAIKRGRQTKRMDNEAIAERFSRLANLMEIRGDDRFRIRSYRNAAETIEVWPTQLKQIAREDGAKGLQQIPGIGKAISGKVLELLEKGTFDAWEKMTAETPASVLDLLRVGGVGLKTAATLHQQFKISSLDDLKKFVAGGGLELVDGIGERSAERIRESLRRL